MHRFHPCAYPAPIGAHLLARRGYALGWVVPDTTPFPTSEALAARWADQHAIHLPGLLDIRPIQGDLARTERWVEGVLEEEDWEVLLQKGAITPRLAGRFQWLSTVFDDTDPQAIARLEFEVREDGSEVWMKASWLSLHEGDPSLRFRFSHGLDRYEDVAADPRRQAHSSALCEQFFPEACWLSNHAPLRELLSDLLGGSIRYVERIVYFNAPDGGAEFHQDVERGHAGVVYAQLSGETFWFALPKEALVEQLRTVLEAPTHSAELIELVGETELSRLRKLARSPASLAIQLDDLGEESLSVVLNRSTALAERLVAGGHAYHVRAGDVLLLPQKDLSQCCWHSVFGLGEAMGEALSFAIRVDPRQETRVSSKRF